MSTQNITTHLWFDYQAEEAAEFYITVLREDSSLMEKPITAMRLAEG